MAAVSCWRLKNPVHRCGFPLFNATDATLDCKNDLSYPKMPFPQRVWLIFGLLSPSKFGNKISSFAYPGCLSRSLDPRSEFFPSRILDSGSKFFTILDPWSQIWIFFHPESWIPDPIKEFKYFNNKKMVSQLSEIWSGFPSRIRILDPDPGSGSWLFTYPGFWS